ncbi:MAG: integration host factor subunit alpha [Desulfobacteraceae bacterium]|nr:integration host factor subunit alpha [Desulfobacteraceae bacterium]
MTLSRQDLIESVYNQSDLSKPEATLVVKSLLEIIKRTLESGEDVLISGFGKFCVKDKKERKGRNPQTGEDLVLRARRVVRFKCSEILAERINSKG